MLIVIVLSLLHILSGSLVTLTNWTAFLETNLSCFMALPCWLGFWQLDYSCHRHR